MNLQSYNDFWQRIHKSAKNRGFPLRVMFELTYRCNFKCNHCYVPQSYRKKKELKTKEIFAILDQLADIGCFYLGFTGGEPFIRNDIFKILWYAKKKGFEVIIYTNGSLIDEKKADELTHLGLNKVDITIPAMSKAAFERISGLKGSQGKVFKAIELLNKRKINLGFKTCGLKENEPEIKDIQSFAASLGAFHRLDDMLSRRLDGSDEPFRYRGTLETTRHPFTSFRTASDPATFGGEAKNLCGDKILQSSEVHPERSRRGLPQNDKNDAHDNIRVNSRLFRCGVGQSQAAITPQGELKMCLMIDYPKYQILNREQGTPPATGQAGYREQKTEDRREKRDLKNAWDRLRDLVNSIKPDKNYKCDKCELQIYCKWCPAKGWLESRSLTSCEPESYRRANLIKELLNC